MAPHSDGSASSPRPFSLIDPKGSWLGSAAPPYSSEQLRAWYRAMRAIQLLDERLALLVGTGRSSIMTSAAGHEAAHVGTAAAVRPGIDWIFPYYRDQGLLLALGIPAVELFGQMLATQADPTKGRQTPTHTGSKRLRIFNMASPVGSHLPVAVGTAMALKRREPGTVAVCTFGDGATSTGDFHGALTLAGVQQAPIVFICENNRFAISVGLEQQSPSETIAAKAPAYGMPGILVDGLDVLAVAETVRTAVERARAGGGPSLIELSLYRYRPHSSSDDDSRYRTKAEVELWQDREPVGRFRRYLESRQGWDTDWETTLTEELKTDLGEALHQAESADPIPPEWMFDDVYATPPWYLEEERDRLSQELD